MVLRYICRRSNFCKQVMPSCTFNMVEELSKSHVYMKDPEFVKKTIQQMTNDGHEKLQVVADFDRTLSKFTNKGKVCSTCHNVLEESKVMPDFYKEKAKVLRDTYYPIEMNHDLTIQEKTPKMIEWWTNAHKLMNQCSVTQVDIKNMVAESTAHLRDGCQWFIDHLHKLEIPLLIFSAGIGDIIEEVIKQQSHMYENMKIVSNYMNFDNAGKMIGFKGDIIHIYNKNENAIHSSDYFERLNHRDNILLLGDSLGDLHMVEGAEVTNLLKIGFLNQKVKESLDLYKEKFDVVIVEDESLDVVNGITKAILNIPSQQ
ncbi:7-methylguanosine phosphate-specific 5'-nucleotidase A isoform X1 [Patella vulgata]|uniref:7-methylguanosine phosphate-specific 5'-nucleotidase A isoform X1 n=1 Tax=Patella vulgata TaxID=6465 RepID=UPI00217FC624|nr:7-methylguanosine phosphate-specific 5'-nucleotidase A isoform X1 [Patella vulgata]